MRQTLCIPLERERFAELRYLIYAFLPYGLLIIVLQDASIYQESIPFSSLYIENYIKNIYKNTSSTFSVYALN